MASNQGAFPAFGSGESLQLRAEQIHLAGSIQPHGALLLVRESDCVMVQASVNAADFLGDHRRAAGNAFAEARGKLWDRVRPHLVGRAGRYSGRGAVSPRRPRKPLNALLHHATGGGLVVELERSGPSRTSRPTSKSPIARISHLRRSRPLCDESARIFKELTGYDRVMVYRFDDEGHGEVFSETRNPDLEAFLGNRYPASDIPQIARRLYERNRVRLLADIELRPVALIPDSRRSPAKISTCRCAFLRSVSPIHVQYLKNMGVAATLVVSLMVGGRLWGLISCHHYSPRPLHFEMRAVCELFAEVIGDAHRRVGELFSGPGGIFGSSARTADDRAHLARGRLARRAFRRRAFVADCRSTPAARRCCLRADPHDRRTSGHRAYSSDHRQWLESEFRQGFFDIEPGAEEPAFAPLTGVASGLVATRISRRTR